ncbi:MAG: hypothetical protein P9F19_15275 [Candidatus Contendobacter sp.]|nr:hypothetical protein [Candidatus Contendobacter sp.]MDG4558735.1 hypothetical protein [Candidatus Contendobacter sp.]
MPTTNQEIKRVARQLFASSRAYVTPFYNRVASKQEMKSLFADRSPLLGGAVLISAPMGTGKTFFIDQMAALLGLEGRAKPLLVGEVDERDLQQAKGEVLFVDEGDIKTTWADLDRGIALIGQHLRNSQRVSLILGDYTLRNPNLLRHLPKHRFLQTFEPLDRPFLQGVLQQRIREYLKRRPEEIIEPALYDILVPDGAAHVNSFRAILTFLESLVRTLPGDRQPCWLTVELAKRYVQDSFDPTLTTDRQENFLNRFLDYLAEHHPRGADLEQGFDQAEMLLIGGPAGYGDWAEFREEIIDPFGLQGLLLSRGIPGLDADGRFVRWPGPYYPSLMLTLMAEG